MANRITRAMKQIRTKDLLAPIIYIILLVPSFVFRIIIKLKRRKLWLVAEQGDARDNGYHFYKYVRKEHPSDYCFYAAKPESAGYEKVAELGNIIKWRSLKHWLYYMSANLNISSQKSGNPCPMFWYIMHVILGLYKNRVFLQHGITKDDADWLYYRNTKFKYFICGAKKEFDYIQGKFGYPNGSLLLTGFPRWDTLMDISMKQKQKSILIMPTWRNWLGGEKNAVFETKDFKKTAFFRSWNALINDRSFISFIEQNNIKVYFYPHINMQKFIDSFTRKSKNIEFISTDSNIQDYFRKCNLMITDYSSVAFDFAYLNKPVIYYQFDLNEYRNRQYHEGYFKYEQDGFGDVIMNEQELIGKIKYYAGRDFKNEQKYISRNEEFFILHDHDNCKRVYEAIK